MRPFATERTGRAAKGIKHPIRDFLFEYYSFRPAHLLRWSPGPDVLLEGATEREVDWNEFHVDAVGAVLPLDQFPERRRSFVEWATNYLESIANRPAQFGCFGLHEWAMVYREPEVRHTRTPLRLHPDQIASIVETEELCCTHYDAFRFFSAPAVPRNRHQLARESTDQFDQPGCIHVTMDLYRYAYKISPWIDSELMADAFELAWQARQVDMRASPYDLVAYGLKPIPIETPEGKAEYVAEQQRILTSASPLRSRMIAAYRRLLEA